MEKRDDEIFMQSPGHRYLAMQGMELRRETKKRARKKGGA